MNAVVIAVIVMLALSLARVHVVLSLTVGAFAGGLLAGMPLTDVADAAGKVSQPGIITVFQNGLSGGAKIALSYAKPATSWPKAAPLPARRAICSSCAAQAHTAPAWRAITTRATGRRKCW